MPAKRVTIPYGLFNKWTKKGYTLVAQQEDKPGCLTMVFTLGWARGRTTLTFVSD